MVPHAPHNTTSHISSTTLSNLNHHEIHIELPGSIQSLTNPKQRLRNILVELELEEDLECETSKRLRLLTWKLLN